jgi:hypothetical protein
MHVFGPSIRQDQAFGVRMSAYLDAHKIAQFALAPIGRGHDIGNALDGGVVAGQMGQNAANYVFAVEGEVMRDEERAGYRALIGANADDVSRVEIAENVLTDRLQSRRFHEHKQAPLGGQIGAQNGGSEPLSQLIESGACDHLKVPSIGRSPPVWPLARRPASGNGA